MEPFAVRVFPQVVDKFKIREYFQYEIEVLANQEEGHLVEESVTL